ncbi:MAG: hypothetical protein WC134_05020 [Acholeplasmataceae bacterium]
MFAKEDYKEARESIKFAIHWELLENKRLSITMQDVFEFIINFINEYSFFPESPHKLRSYIQTNNISLAKKRKILCHTLPSDSSTVEEMINDAIDYSLCVIIYNGLPKNLKSFRKEFNL